MKVFDFVPPIRLSFIYRYLSVDFRVRYVLLVLCTVQVYIVLTIYQTFLFLNPLYPNSFMLCVRSDNPPAYRAVLYDPGYCSDITSSASCATKYVI